MNVKEGQVWKRRGSEQETVVLSVDPDWNVMRYVVHRSKRRTYTEYSNFIRKYEFVGEHQ